MNHVACESKLRSVVGHTCIHAKENVWQSGVRSCIMPRLPAYVVQELNVDIVVFHNYEGAYLTGEKEILTPFGKRPPKNRFSIYLKSVR